MKNPPNYLATQRMANGAINLTDGTQKTTPAYRRILISDQGAQDEEQRALAAINRDGSLDDENDLVSMLNPQCRVLASGPHDAKLIRVSAGYRSSAFAGGYRTAVYLELPGLNCAVEVSFDSWPKVDKTGEYDHLTAFVKNADVTPFDWKETTFYDRIRYNQIRYAAQKPNSEAYLLVTECDPGPGLLSLTEIHQLDKSAPKRNAVHKLSPGRGIKTDPLPDLSEIGIPSAEYAPVDIKKLSADICVAAGSYKDGLHLITPANYTRVSHDFIPKLI